MPHYIQCEYCREYKLQSEITKEHVIPRTYGGTVTIPPADHAIKNAEHPCSILPFVDWTEREPELWAHANATIGLSSGGPDSSSRGPRVRRKHSLTLG